MSLEDCSRCNEPLKKVRYARVNPTQCGRCRADSIPRQFKDIQELCIAQSVISDDELMFTDEPNVPEQTVHFRYRVSNSSNIRSSLSELSS